MLVLLCFLEILLQSCYSLRKHLERIPVCLVNFEHDILVGRVMPIVCIC
jgi:hypothetical protein